jgi:hypothetical protein
MKEKTRFSKKQLRTNRNICLCSQDVFIAEIIDPIWTVLHQEKNLRKNPCPCLPECIYFHVHATQDVFIAEIIEPIWTVLHQEKNLRKIHDHAFKDVFISCPCNTGCNYY